ncbi:MAG: hypothetical protein K2G85_04155 [Muribaculaceae bacterium]|nr:hypothetical protein [Muribaculaceae bacterium]
MKRLFLFSIINCLFTFLSTAQIGYQVSLLNNATGEPRANERVKVTVKITDSKDNVVCEETKNETTNDFGVISMNVGDSDTFSNADWNNLPFYIEASVDGRLIGKSQLLSVPVAEYAKHTGSLTIELLCSKEWKHIDDDGSYSRSYQFNKNGKYFRSDSLNGEYDVVGDKVILKRDGDGWVSVLFYSPLWNILVDDYGGDSYK